MEKTRFYCVISLLFYLTSCSSLNRSLLLGTGTGIATGAFIGTAGSVRNKKNNAAKGALIGGLLGLGGGYFLHGKLEKRDAETRQKMLLNLDKFGAGKSRIKTTLPLPMLTKPIVGSEWVDTKIEGNKLIEAHRVWIIEENSGWVPNGQKEKKE